MSLVRVVTLVAAVATLTTPLEGQGIPRRATSSSGQQASQAPRLMVANPFAFASADSAAAVQLGTAIRSRIDDVVGRDFTVVEQSQMNDALTQYGYPRDAILNPALANTLAKNIQARVALTSTLSRGPGGRYTVTARLAGVND